MEFHIPKEVTEVVWELEAAGFQAYLVGGCVRDLLRGTLYGELVEPKDWDITTNATPEEIQRIFPDSVYENQFGTVLVKLGHRTTQADTQTNAEGNGLRESALSPRKSAPLIVEVTTFRLEGIYTDRRHPDEIKFAATIEEDLSRRDFTINALAMKLIEDRRSRIEGKKSKEKEDTHFEHRTSSFELRDPFNGQEDLKNRIVRTVGDPNERFNEDALRLMRAVRFVVELGSAEFQLEQSRRAFSNEDESVSRSNSSDWEIEFNTRRAIEKNAGLLEMIAKERIRDEFLKILMADKAATGIVLLEELDLLRFVLPELREGIGVTQNKHHIYSVFEHNLKALEYAAQKRYSLVVRLASLLHDVGKPRTKRGEGPDATFYNHEVVGSRMGAGALERLRISKETIEKTIHLIRYHMFYYNVGEVTEAGVRRFIRRVGSDSISELIQVREADRIGSGVPKAVPYKIRHLLFMIEKVKQDPLSPKMLRLNGNEVMEITGLLPGPKVGQIVNILLEDVLDDPSRNNREYLKERTRELSDLDDQELRALAEKAHERKDESEQGIEEEIKKKYGVS